MNTTGVFFGFLKGGGEGLSRKSGYISVTSHVHTRQNLKENYQLLVVIAHRRKSAN